MSEKIVKEAKEIMDNFVRALGDAKLDVNFGVNRDKNIRGDVQLLVNDDFTDRMLKNAPEVKNRCIVAERKKW
jgi:Asp-tRNA(Asn)/Glu-tRNA(Gln) amidotransferase C subunit